MGCSGPGALNMLTGVATAWADEQPRSSRSAGPARASRTRCNTFQEVDQVEVFRPVTKWAMRVNAPARIPDVVEEAFQRARGGRPGPVYLDFPADVLFGSVAEKAPEGKEASRPFKSRSDRPSRPRFGARSPIRPTSSERPGCSQTAERPLIVSGTGVIWSEASDELRTVVETVGAPFYTTPQGRGVIPEDHALSLLGGPLRGLPRGRPRAGRRHPPELHDRVRPPPRFNADAKLIQVDIDPEQIGHNRAVDVGSSAMPGRCWSSSATAAGPLIRRPATVRLGREPDRDRRRSKARSTRNAAVNDQTTDPPAAALQGGPRLPRTGTRSWSWTARRSSNYGRQSIPTFRPGHRLNSGPFGTMGVGLPFGLGAKVAAPDKQVLVVHGDGSFGLNAMEIDTAVRHDVPIICIISNNGGWTATRPGPHRPGRDLGYTRYDIVSEGLGAHVEYVDDPAEIRPALERAAASGRPAVINVITDPTAKAEQVRFSAHEVD